MTISGIFESLIATAIWAILGFAVYRIKKRFDEENEKYQTLFSDLKMAISANEDPAQINTMYFSINLLLNRFQRKLNRLYNDRIVSIVILIVFSYFAFNNKHPYDGAILLIIYTALIGYETFSINRISNRIDEIESNVVKGIGERIELLNSFKKD